MPTVALLVNRESGWGDAIGAERELGVHGAAVQAFSIAEAGKVAEIEPDRIVVAGGDGSIGCAAELAVRTGVPLAVIPAGTANDFARALSLPTNLADACALAVEGSRTRSLDLGRIDERPFVNVASIGLAPLAASRAHGLKRLFGPAAYAVGALEAGLRAEPVPCRLRSGDGSELFAAPAWQLTVACSGAFGAGARLDADPGDGMLDAVAVEAGSRVALVLRAYGMRAGTLAEQRGVHNHRAAAFEVEVEPETPFNVDGELCVRSGLVRFTIAPAPVEVVVA